MTKSKVVLAKSQLDSCIQMLHKNEKLMLLNTPDLCLSLTNDGGNNFTLRYSKSQNATRKYTGRSGKLRHLRIGLLSEHGTNLYVLDATSEEDAKLHPSGRRLLAYLSQQLPSVYNTACTVSQNMQSVFDTAVF